MDAASSLNLAHLLLAGRAKQASIVCAADRGYEVPPGEAALTRLQPLQVAARALAAADAARTTLGAALSFRYTAASAAAPLRTLEIIFLDATPGALGRQTALDQVLSVLDAHAPAASADLLLLAPTELSPEALRRLAARPDARALRWDEMLTPPTASPQVPLPRALSAADAREYLGRHGLQRSQLPLLSPQDVLARWYGWRKGRLVYFDRSASSVVRVVG